LTQWF